jgi:DNA-binding response OmpR family regulator/anti-sigma regulatory factor (Ser/Thr protein kinase)
MSGPVLVVDDSLTVRADLMEALAAEGLRSIGCASLGEAREVLRTQDVGVVVLDLLLPDGDGIDLLAEIRATPGGARMPVLMLSTEAEVHDRIRGLELGSSDYVGKPYDRAHVVARVRELVGTRTIGATSSKVRVLVIDDSPTFREEAAHSLRAQGYEVLTAASGEEGLRSVNANRPGAVIVDAVLPGLDGPSVVRRLRIDAPVRQTPCILLTGAGGADAELRALDAGADAFVRKEEGIEMLLARLAAVLRSAGGAGVERDTASLLSPKKILAADRDAASLDELAAALRDEGHDVIQARSGEEVLQMLSVQAVDCILIERDVPGLGGAEACRRIKRSRAVRNIPLIMLVDPAGPETVIAALSDGADDCVVKTGDVQVLKAHVRAQLRRKQLEDESRHIRAEMMVKELQAAQARAARELAASRAELLAELEQKNRELEEASRVKSEFVSRMSHELRTPLNAVIGFSQLLVANVETPLSSRQRAQVEAILQAGCHLLALVDDILDVSRIESGQMQIESARVSLRDLLDEVLELMASQARRGEVVFEPAYREQPPASALGDRVRLRQALLNIVSNAVKYNRRGGSVRAELSTAGACVCVQVTDTGFGMTREQMRHLYEPFNRLGRERDGIEGTGIGLTLTRQLLQLMHGSLEIESEPEHGTTVRVVLPMAPVSDQESQAVASEPLEQIAADEDPAGVVLYIEDNPVNMMLVEQALAFSLPHVRLVQAELGCMGIELARTLRPDLVLLDMRLPDLDGAEVLRTLRADADTRALYVATLSASAMTEDIACARDCGASECWTKPLDIDRFVADVRRVLRERGQAQSKLSSCRPVSG